MNYAEFLQKKKVVDIPTGIPSELMNPVNVMAFDFQRDIIKWALRRGRAAIFADCGLGKSLMQLEWGRHVAEYTKGNILILAPLAVSEQTVREGDKFGISVKICETQNDISNGLNITNYEKIENFDLSSFSGIILDESSILKNYTGEYRNLIIERAKQVQFKLACTATPAPNDFMELGNHSEFLGSMSRAEMLSMFFVHDGGETQKWRLKGHAQKDFWKWVCSWAVMIRKPSDLGYSDEKFILPKLRVHQVSVESESFGDFLIKMDAKTLQERQQARRDTVELRARAAADIIAKNPNEQWLAWSNLNNEADAISKLANMVNVQGSDKNEFKAKSMFGFASGEISKLSTKPKIGGLGMNWQNCHNVVFLGLSDSWEQYYQCVRRCWRFGQKHDVDVWIVTADVEGEVVRNIERKERDAEIMANEMVSNMKDINAAEIHGMEKTETDYETDVFSGKNFTAYLGDNIETIKNIPDGSVDFSVFSPPFASLYTYSNSERDMGNCANDSEFYTHFQFLINELFRVLRPGRNISFHCMNLPTSKCRDGMIGIKDFRGDLIRLFEKAGFIYHSEVCIWKDPVTAMQRTKAIGLLHKQIVKDSSISRQGIPDYLVTMRKPGENTKPISGELTYFCGDMSTFQSDGRLSIDIWQRYASPVWMDINPSRTLQYMTARENNDERHICPLQLDVIERAIQLWSIEGDTVLSPFMGIGSEGYVSLKMKRKFIGFELKKSYFNVAIKNLIEAENSMCEADLFDTVNA